MEFKQWLEDEEGLRLAHNPKFQKALERLGNLPPRLYFVVQPQNLDQVLHHGLGGPGYHQPYQGFDPDRGVDLFARPQGEGRVIGVQTTEIDLDSLEREGDHYHYTGEIPPDKLSLLS